MLSRKLRVRVLSLTRRNKFLMIACCFLLSRGSVYINRGAGGKRVRLKTERMVSVHNRLPEDELLDLRVIETYVPAFMVIMKTLAILGLIPLLSSMGFSHGNIYTLVATLLFIDRNLHSYYMNPGSLGREKRLMDSNMSVCCVLLCFVVNSSRPLELSGLGLRELLLNVIWCFIGLWLLVRDELPLLRFLGFDIGLCPMIRKNEHSYRSDNYKNDYRPEIIPSAIMFYMHSSTPILQTSMLELSVRSITFQCLTVSWYYTYKIRNPPNEDCTFIMSMVRFMPVLFVSKWVACVFAGIVWICIMIRFYQEQNVLSNRLAGNIENPAILQVVNGSQRMSQRIEMEEADQVPEPSKPPSKPEANKAAPNKAVSNSEDMELFLEALRQNNKL